MFVVLPHPICVNVVFASPEELSFKPSTVPLFAKPRTETSTSPTRKTFFFLAVEELSYKISLNPSISNDLEPNLFKFSVFDLIIYNFIFLSHLCSSRLLANLTPTPECSSGAQIVHTSWYVFYSVLKWAWPIVLCVN